MIECGDFSDEPIASGPNGSETSFKIQQSSNGLYQDNLFLDTETCGFHGLAVLIQYALGDGEIVLFEPWRRPIQETLNLIEWICKQNVVGFNLAFDWFHINKLYTTFFEYISKGGDQTAEPVDIVEELAICEELARFSNICLKPRSALDLMLHARKGPYQSLMARKDIRIKRVPRIMAERLQRELESRIQLDGIYFDKRADKDAPNWTVEDIRDEDEILDVDFCNIVLKFNPNGALKSLAKHVLCATGILKMPDVEINPKFYPEEFGYAPFALAVGKPGKWKGAWPAVIKEHIYHWAFNERARKYGTDDIIYTRGLRYAWPEATMGDDDSILACAVGAIRWRGYDVDLPRIAEQRKESLKRMSLAPKDAGAVKRWLTEVCDKDEFEIFRQRGTGKVILQEVGGIFDDDIQQYTGDFWTNDDGTLHQAAQRCRDVFDARRAGKEVELYDKLLKAKRFHASFVVIGTLSTRMAGSDDLNPQGIMSAKEIRECFTLSDENYQLDGGDFDAFEVCISAAVYDDKGLEDDIRSGKKIHALLAQAIYPDKTYDEIMASKGSKSKDYYTDGKRAVFGLNYGGDANTLVNRLGIALELAEAAFKRFEKRYPGVKRARQKTIDLFCSMRQPGGLGTRVEWHEPAEKATSLLGFHRYFTLENQICKALFDLSAKPPKEWKDIRVKVVRRDRQQTASGAVQSALYGAAFAIQGSSMRAAANHVIQSTGGGVTKRVQRKVWDIQPCGIERFVVLPMNIHDEVLSLVDPRFSNQVKEVVDTEVLSFRPIIPLISMEWKQNMESWGSK